MTFITIFFDEVIALACNFWLNRLHISSQFIQKQTRIIRFFFVSSQKCLPFFKAK